MRRVSTNREVYVVQIPPSTMDAEILSQVLGDAPSEQLNNMSAAFADACHGACARTNRTSWADVLASTGDRRVDAIQQLLLQLCFSAINGIARVSLPALSALGARDAKGRVIDDRACLVNATAQRGDCIQQVSSGQYMCAHAYNMHIQKYMYMYIYIYI